ncbi:non-ribosomal peptide synthetase [uncultured Kordia sp.]|uniref:non-ribosomal peptide synthetase n=1 Tax=uncultured Kordia sp. TaxID=507699 RepID=UPI0026282D9E|nr:non-ribosomal peptide synthetase [uncultured Kordia sp.]
MLNVKNIKDIYKLAPLQEGILFHSLMDKTSSAYVEQSTYQLGGGVNVAFIEKSFNELLRRHDILRTVFKYDKTNVPLQAILKERKIEFRFEDIRSIKDSEDQKAFIEDFKARDKSRGFDLNRDVLMRIAVLKATDTEYYLIWTFHHIIMDGWSRGVLIEEFYKIYNSFQSKQPIKMSHVQPYGAYIKWLEKQDLKKSYAFWKNYLVNYDAGASIPKSVIDTDEKEYNAGEIDLKIDKTLTHNLKTYAKENLVTLNTVIQSLWGILLGKYNNTKDIVFGSVVSGRPAEIAGIESMVGLFINTLPVRISYTQNQTFTDFLKKTQKEAISSEPHHMCKLAEIQQISGLDNTLLDHILVFESYPVSEQIASLNDQTNIEEDNSLKLEISGVESFEQTNYNFNVIVFPGEELIIKFLFNKNVYNEDLVNNITVHIENLLKQICSQPTVTIDELVVLSDSEKESILTEFNDTKSTYPKDKCISEIFEEQVAKNPHAPAMVCEGKTLSYQEANEQSNQIAHYLRTNFSIRPDDIVGIIANRSEKTLLLILGIIKAGGAYLAIDPSYPAQRISYIVEQSGLKALIIGDDVEIPSEIKGLQLEEVLEEIKNYPTHNPEIINTSRDLAYVIYTSGSTGVPKGVQVEHYSVSRLVINTNFIQLSNTDRLLPSATTSFDVSTFEIWGMLLNGGSIYIYKKETILEASELEHNLKKDKINILWLSSSLFNEMCDISPTMFSDLKYLLVGGERLSPSHINKAKKANPSLCIINGYGPTENTTFSTCHQIDKIYKHSIPIGKPIANSTAYVFDEQMALVPVGGIGEILVGGDGLARGYLNNEELTNEKFITNPFKEGERLYKTGDIGRLMPGGIIEYIGRIDFQIKLRGYRIERDEIITILEELPEIEKAVVTLNEGESYEKYLVAYFTAKEGSNLSESSIRDYLSQKLPNYMIPSFFVQLDKFLLTTNGKLDTRALPKVDEAKLQDLSEYVAPRTEVEKIVAKIWGDVIGTQKVGAKDNFFTLGGDSIKAIQVTARVSKVGYRIYVKDIMQYPVLEELALRVRSIDKLIDQSPVKGNVGLTPIQKAFFSIPHVNHNHFNQSVMLHLKVEVPENDIKTILSLLQNHHDALRMTFRKDADQILQENHGLEYPISFSVFDLTNEENAVEILEEKATKLQAGIDLENGPMMKSALFKLKDGNRLLIAIHHLSVDGVSWRIIFEDFGTLLQQYQDKQKFNLPEKTLSFKNWSENLKEYANSSILLREKEYWKKDQHEKVFSIPKDFKVNENFVKDVAVASFKLGKEQTTQLLTKTNSAYNTEINDILLAGLTLGVNTVWNLDQVLISLEGHGRQDIGKELDISRTVGWFTSVYPVIFNVNSNEELPNTIINVKEVLRQIPNKGIGYQLLQHVTDAKNKEGINFNLTPNISFNYLGQFDQDIVNSLFNIAEESGGKVSDPHNNRSFDIDVSGIISEGSLEITIAYNKNHFKENTITAFSEKYKNALHTIITHCTQQQDSIRTPGDFSYKGLSMSELETLTNTVEVDDIYSLSPMQEGMLFNALYDSTSSAYFYQSSYRILGHLDAEIVEKSFNELFKRHHVLRNSFCYENVNKPYQVVRKNAKVDFTFEDISGLTSDKEKEEFVEAFKEKDKIRSFHLTKDVLMRIGVIKLEDNTFELVWSYHHILMDGWCVGILNTEFYQIYNLLLNNKPIQLERVTPYSEYLHWLEKKDLEGSRQYWKQTLQDYEGIVSLPKIATGNKEGYKYKQIDLKIDVEQTDNIRKLAATCKVTLNSIIQTVWGILLGKYNGRKDVVFGGVVSGRPSEIHGIESMIGLFINTIPVRIKFNDDQKFIDLVAEVHKESVENQSHSYCQLADIQNLTRAGQPILDHLLIFENFPQSEQIEEMIEMMDKDEGKLNIEIPEVSVYDHTSYDFEINVLPGKQLVLEFIFNENIYSSEFITSISSHFEQIMNTVLANPNSEIKSLEILSEKEKATLANFNATEVALPESLSYLDHLDKIRQESPLKTAVISGDISVSYDDLWSRTNQLAHYLQTEHQIGKGSIVLVLLDRSLELMETILAIWKCGAAYIPLDPNFPISRIQEIVASSKSSLMVSLSGFTSGLTDLCDFLHLDKEATNISNHSKSAVSLAFEPSDLAYVIYTSGSTGKPKGAMVEHIGMLNHLYSKVDVLELTQESIVSFNAPPIFDISVWQMFSGLLVGGSTVIYSQDLVLKPTAFMAQVKSDTISILEVVPSYLSLLLDTIEEGDTEAFFPALKYLMVTGETLKPVLARRWFSLFSDIPMVNAYGPTEASDDITHHVLDKAPEMERVPIGKTVQNFHIHIVDESFNVCPIGVTGEIVVSGLGVGRGYLNDAERTDAVFIEDPFRKGVRMYRTGDLGRYLPNGDLDFLGRKDHQVKIRGHRIELGDIENHFVGLEGVKEAVVLDKEDNEGRKYLCAYLVLSEDVELDILKQKLGDRLPSYMLPSSYVLLDTMPLTSNGKLDRKTLLGYTEELHSNADTYVAARNEVEAALVSIWQEVLGKQQIGVMDNFFAVGGDSIKAVQVASRMGKAGYRLSVQNIMRYLVLSELAIHVKKSERSVDQSVISGMVPLNAIQEWFFESGHDSPWHYNQSMLLDFEQVVTPETIKAIFTTLQTHHDALRMVFSKETGKWLQENKDLDHPLWLETYDLRGVIAWSSILSNKAAELQSSLRLETGPLMKLNLYHTDQGSKLLMVVHHLIMDGISWRILLEDLEDLYTQSKQGATRLKLSDKTLSFKDWSVHMQEQSNSEAIQSEATYWQSILSSAGTTTIPRDLNGTDNQIQDTETFRATLNVSDTTLLQEQAHTAYNTEINDFLLTALGRSIHELWGKEEMLISLEGHGREELGDIDINRTIGWFTSEFPVLLKVSNEEDLLDTLIWTKEHLRKIPNKGIGYGLLAYVGDDKLVDRVRPQIGFNYLGDFDNDLSGKSFRVSSESIGMLSASTNQNDNELLINSMIVDGKLHIGMTYNTTHFMATTIENLVLRYKENLEALIAQCSKLNSTTLTPSDYSYRGLSNDNLNSLREDFEVEDINLLSPLQEGMLFHTLYDNNSSAYFYQIAYQLKGTLKISLVEEAFNELLKRHEVLRSVYIHDLVEDPLQITLKKQKVKFSYEDISHLKASSEKESFIALFKEQDKLNTFNVSKDKLVRIAVIKEDNNTFQLIWSFHHIVMDGWCVGILNNEFLQIYYNLLQGKSPKLPKLRPYSTYIQWLQELNIKTSLSFWENYLEGYEELVTISKFNKNTDNAPVFQRNEVSFKLNEYQKNTLNEIASKNEVTMSTCIQAIWGILLGKYNNTNDVIFGLVVSGRPAEVVDVESMVGLFVNTIPLRVKFSKDSTFTQLLKEIKTSANEREPHQYCQLAEVQSKSNLKQNLFDHLMVFDNYPASDEINDLIGEINKDATDKFDVEAVEVFEHTDYDLEITVLSGDQMEVRFIFNGNVYEEELITSISSHFEQIMNTVLAKPNSEIKSLEILSEKEKATLAGFNATEVALPESLSYLDHLDKIRQESPLKTAAVSGDISVSYDDLWSRTNQLAHYLQTEHQIGKGSIVLVLLDRSLDLMETILAIWKCGAAYIPLDPNFPISRIQEIVASSKSSLMVSLSGFTSGLTDLCDFLHLDKEATNISNHSTAAVSLAFEPSDLAYVIYTSGSTGKPKGAMVEHIGMLNHLYSKVDVLELTQESIVSFNAPPIFDISVWQMFSGLLVGGSTVIYSQDLVLKPTAFMAQVKSDTISILEVVPSYLSLLLDTIEEGDTEAFFPALKYLMVTGETLKPVLARRWFSLFSDIPMVNAYGPTEASDDITHHVLDKAPELERVPIGKTVQNFHIHIVDESFNVCPIGVTGEIVVSGLGVGRGYLNDAERTSKVFIEDPFRKGVRMYRTGDLGRYLPNGDLDFLGRKDHQVKIRGHRIELGDIENHFVGLEGVKEAVVLDKEDNEGRKYLCAYLVLSEAVELDILKQKLGDRLPNYMLPSSYVLLDTMPLTSNGKLDRKTLLGYTEELQSNADTYVAARNEVEAALVSIWQEVLGKQQIGVMDNFFDIGGHSLKATQVVSKILKRLHVTIELRELFENPTIEGLATHVKRVIWSNEDEINEGEYEELIL